MSELRMKNGANETVFENEDAAEEYVTDLLEEYDSLKEASKLKIVKAMALSKGWNIRD